MTVELINHKFFDSLKSIINFIAFSNFFVAIAVTALSIETMIMFGFSDFKYPVFIFFLTLFIYSFHRIYRLNHRSSKERQEGRHRWVKKNLGTALSILFFSGIGIAYCIIFWTNLFTFLCLMPIAVVTLGYSIPFIKTAGKIIRLRDVPGLKIFLISIVLGLTTVVLPLIFYSKINTISYPELLLVFVRRVLFIFAITLPFDIRDIQYDAENNVKTIPLLFGIKRSKQFAVFALVVFILLALLQFFFFNNLNSNYIVSLIISAIITLFIILETGKEKQELFYSFFIEGTMLLQLFLVIIICN